MWRIQSTVKVYRLLPPTSLYSSRPSRSFTTSVQQRPLPTGGHSSHLTFAGAKKFPILSPDAISTLIQTLKTIESDSDLRVLFLRSTIAGADLNHMKSIDSPQSARSFIQHLDRLCSAIQDFRVPVVAALEGPCLGAGMEVAAACDLRIAVRGTLFGMPETRVGIPSVIQATLIPGLVGWGRARELLYFGDVIDADTAHAWGFVNAVVEKDGLESKVVEWERRFADTSPAALTAQKKLMRTWEEYGTGRAGVEAGVEAFGRAFETDEPTQSMEKFFREKELKKAR